MADQVSEKHFIIVTYPGPSHMNPVVEFAKRVIHAGGQVTFLTSVYAQKRLLNKADSYPDGLSFALFSDGYDDGITTDDPDQYFAELRELGSAALSSLVQTRVEEGRPIACLIYTLFLPWAAEVAQKFQLHSSLLWIQPATVFDLNYYFFCGYKEVILHNINDPAYSVELPGLPLLKSQDLPSFFLPSNPYPFGVNLFQEQFEIFSRNTTQIQVLINTFDDLEPEALKAIKKFSLISVGPLIPSVFLDGNDSRGRDSGGDYFEWLDSKEKSSVVYISFGNFTLLNEKQMEELARGLVDSGRPFLWVIRSGEKVLGQSLGDKFHEIVSQEHKGMIVPWCSQVDVLNHPSVGCFVTHGGWNSTMEALAMGVPLVVFPQRSDQTTNAKLIEDVWKIGVRVRVRPSEEDAIVTSEEIKRCLEQVIEGATSEVFKSNSKKWKTLAREAGKRGGSAHMNLQAFVEGVGQGSS